MPAISAQSSFWLEALGAEVRFYDAGGARTRCIEAGTGPPMILLHGLSGHAETWIRNVRTLSEQYHVYALDMLGHGLSAKPAIDYTVEVLARHVLDFMDTVEAAPAVLVGQSLGGWVAGRLAVHHPDRVAALVSATGAGLQVTTEHADLARRVGSQVRDVTARATERPSRDGVRARLEWLLHDKALVTDELVETRYRVYTDPEFMAISGRLLAGATDMAAEYLLTRDQLERIACPTLILWTRHNPTTPWEVGQAASEVIPGADFHLMEDAGHWPQFERPDEFHRVVLGFLAKHVAQAST